MRRHCHRAQLIDEVFRVVGLVGAERDRARPVGVRFDHGERRYPLGMAVSRRQTSINQKAMAVLHQAMADEAKLGFLSRSLAIEPCIGIRRRDMRLVRPLAASRCISLSSLTSFSFKCTVFAASSSDGSCRSAVSSCAR